MHIHNANSKLQTRKGEIYVHYVHHVLFTQWKHARLLLCVLHLRNTKNDPPLDFQEDVFQDVLLFCDKAANHDFLARMLMD